METCYCVCFMLNVVDACFIDKNKARQFIINKYFIHDKAFKDMSENDLNIIADRYIIESSLIK